MMSDVSALPKTNAKTYLEWTVVTLAILGGSAIALTGIGYGLTNTTGVGAGFFPVVAGSAIALGGVLWAFQLIGDARHRRNDSIAPQTDGDRADHAANFDRVDPPTDTAIGVLVVDGIDEEDDDIALPDRKGVKRVALVVLALVLAAVVLPWIGYLLTMTLMLFAVLTLVSERRWWIALIVGFGAAIASRFVFETLLGTALPHASLDFLRMMGL
jgi:Tripartite tricarboxylate transporter TctB family